MWKIFHEQGRNAFDAAITLDQMQPDIVMRTSFSGAVHFARSVRRLSCRRGMNEHPTQALLDLYDAGFVDKDLKKNW